MFDIPLRAGYNVDNDLSYQRGKKMSQIILDIPDLLAGLPEKERDRLIRGGVYEATRARVRQLSKEIADCRAHLQDFEGQYEVSFDRFEAELLPTLDTLQAHEDYNDWFFWQKLLDENQRILSEIRLAGFG